MYDRDVGWKSRWYCAALAAGCGPSVDTDLPEGGFTSSTTGAPLDTSTGASVTTSTAETGASSDATTTSSDAGFLSSWDMGPSSWQCSTFEQDCPPGQKCTLWADDGGPAFNSARCVDIAPNPVGLGETCTLIDASSVSGLDDCDLGLLCWYVLDGQGTCVEFCGGAPEAPECPPDHQCTISGAGVLSICIAECDPIEQDCEPGFACYPVNDGFTCAADASGPAGAHGDPCRFINACDPGLVCIGADAHSGCDGALGCCSTACDVTDPMADAACTMLDAGQTCESWWVFDMAPRGYENVGVCAIPPR